MKVAILGAGMAGLLAAKALSERGINFILYDKNPQEGASSNQGLHYLHDSCGLPLKPQIVNNYVIGCRDGEHPHEQYSRKLGTPLNNSLVGLPAFNTVYNFKEAHQILLYLMQGEIRQLTFEPTMMKGFLEHYDLVVSTLPLPVVYPQAKCEFTEVQAIQGRPKGVPKLPGANQVVYNIEENTNWYRYSKVFGVEWTEVKQGGDFTLKKVVDSNFEPPDKRVILLGRWGQWNRKFLAHQAYYQILRRIEEHGF